MMPSPEQKVPQPIEGQVKNRFLLRLFCMFTGVSLVSIMVFILLFMRYQNISLSQGLMQHGKLLSEILVRNSRLGVFSENRELLRDLVDGISKQESVLYVDLYTREGEKLIEATHSGNASKHINASAFDAYIREEKRVLVLDRENLIEFWSPVVSRKADLGEDSLMLYDLAETEFDQIIGYGRLIIGKELLHRRLKDLSLRIMIASLLFWIAGASLIFLLVKRLTTPLKRLTHAVLNIRDTGDLNKIPIETNDEIGDLAHAFNKMSLSLQQREMEKRWLEDQLRLAQKMEAIGTLAGGIAHDFNNILGAIIGYSELGMMEADGNEAVRKRITEILAAGNRGSELVRQILTFSRQSEKSRNPIQASIIIKEVLKLLKPSLPSFIKVKTRIDPHCGLVVSDATAIHQIVMNLCTNALHAMKNTQGTLEVILCDIDVNGNGPEIKIPDMPPGRYQRLSIKDDGHGINPEISNRIFDPFFTTKGVGEGTGMGLSVVHGIVKDHKGFVSVDSDRGKGTRFDIYLPLLDLDAVIEERKSEETEPARGDEVVLLVDDEKAMVESTREILESLGYTVVPAENSMDALKIFQNHPKKFDLVITDMAMPEMSGLELSIALLKIRPDMPIILFTGYSEQIDEKTAKKLGVKDTVFKPVIRKKLAAVIRKALDARAKIG